ncbi:PIN domain-containing protein [Candidatus Albibeggiatoa sp. nov. BB20]|uniref:PIN domain-containing protein n=1 Tax=Candidatus Albibeggiatoa sp. nov. BB20 TaxID=3162723 RepID=UPI0033659CDF
MLVDSDVLIWFLKGNTKALTKSQQLDKIEISAISYMELIQGMRNKQELQALQKTIQQFQWQIIPLDKQISDYATDYVEQFFLSHSLR